MRPAPNTALIYIHMHQIYTIEIDNKKKAGHAALKCL